jgi:hypothetical protein
MAAILGAIKGIWRAIVLIGVAVLLPALAWLVASLADGALGLGFTTIFLAVLALGAVLAVAAIFGAAAEMQKAHCEAMDEAARERRPEEPA